MFTISGTTYTADKTFSKRSNIRRYMSDYGLGSSQAKLAGRNPIDQELVAVFRNRPKADINAITDFLDGTKGSTSFAFTLPEGQTIKVTLIRYTKNYEYDNYYTLTIELEKVNDL